ncbi:uncharacterized protein zgc:194621 isoform X2 [Betta splendens]|uniref:Uncharacterized protein zgc:194621 isoform X2 n=1 Tax=Betta splendens TaxID=158456 RepID=A0A6P7M5Z1_BETSP|nr:uncharacterized protein zgc:194621 isoform X2 [Betta splendens]
MPAAKVIKAKPVETTGKSLEKPKPMKVKAAEGELKVPAVRKGRASSCPRRPQRDRSDGTLAGAHGAASKARTRSNSSAPRLNGASAKTNTVDRKHAGVSPKCRGPTARPVQRDQRSLRAETKYGIQSHKAFTVIPPDPKKRREIQRKAEAELAALEELRLSRAMAYVSINPSSVGGCMSLEEVRSKQQQEMIQAKRKQKPMKKQVMEHTPVLTS